MSNKNFWAVDVFYSMSCTDTYSVKINLKVMHAELNYSTNYSTIAGCMLCTF